MVMLLFIVMKFATHGRNVLLFIVMKLATHGRTVTASDESLVVSFR